MRHILLKIRREYTGKDDFGKRLVHIPREHPYRYHFGKPTESRQDNHVNVLNEAIPPGDILLIPRRDMASSKKLDAMSPHTGLLEIVTDVVPGSDDSSLEHPHDVDDVDTECLRRHGG